MKVNVEKLVVKFLQNNCDYPVYVKVPNDEPEKPSPEEFVIVQGCGGRHSGLTGAGNAVMAVQTYGSTFLRASDIAYEISEILFDLPDEKKVIKADVSIPQNFTDDRPRYQINLDLMVKD